MKLHGLNLVAGERSGKGSQAFFAFDPARNRRLEPSFREATSEEVTAAVERAQEAFWGLGRLSPNAKAELLEAAAEEMEGLGEALIQRAAAETGLPEARLIGERGRTVQQLRIFADLVREGSWVEARIDRAQPERQPARRPDLRRMLIPLGPVAVFGASNFPLAFSVAGGDTASALAAGNPVVAKAHPAHPGTSELVGEALGRAVARAGLPAGFFSLVHGVGLQVGHDLVTSPGIRAVGFTGSLAGGRALFDLAARRPDPIPVYAEMGSVNPVILLPKALEERGTQIADGLLASVTLGVGQFCTNPGLVLAIDSPALKAVKARLAAAAAETPAATMLHAGIRGAFEAGVEKLAGKPNVELLALARDRGRAERTEGAVRVFGVSAADFLSDPELATEVFGPCTLVVTCADEAELLGVVKQLDGQLTATLHAAAEEAAAYPELLRCLEHRVGRVVFNGFPTGVEVCPAMHHGGPYPATTDVRSTSVGTAAIQRFARPVCFQDCPQDLLPAELRDRNPRRLWRLVDGVLTQADG